jgi:hypothetical protein
MTATDTGLLADLRALHELLAEPERWTRFVSARDEDGREAGIHAPCAASWCFYGGMSRVVSTQDARRSYDRFSALWGVLDPILRQTGWEAGAEDLIGWNDAPERTHAEVLALIDDAISRVGASS